VLLDKSSPGKLERQEILHETLQDFVQDTLVLGIGNPLMGDDGVGSQVIKLLADSSLPPNAKIEDAGLPGWGLPAWFEGWSNVILVDAVQMGQAPGSWRRFRPQEVQLELESDALSLHQPDLACGLALAQALDLLPENLILYGVEPDAVDPGEALSPAVCHNLPDVVASILNELEKIKV
jgi:hydrogenase maturation protease